MFPLSPRKFHSLLILPALLSIMFAGESKDNQPPVANSDHYTVHGTFGTPLDSPPYGVLKNDSDPDGDPLSCVFTQVNTSLGTATVFANGRADFVAASGQTGIVTIPYTVCDNHGSCSDSTVAFDVVNQPPVAGADEYTVHGEFVTPNEVPLTGVLKNDTDPEGDSLYCVEKRVDTAIGTAIIFANGKAQFEESKNGQTGDVSTTSTVCDNLGACSEGSVTFHVVNQAPVAGDDFYVVQGSEFDTPLETPNGVLKNDSDPEGDATHTFFVRADFNQGVGFVFDNGKASFVRSSNWLTFTGDLSLQYTLCDALGACSRGTVTFQLIGDGQDDGTTSCNANIGGPINVTNGNMYLQQSDYSLPAVGPAINVTRTFNSNSQSTGIFGRGWSTSYDQSIVTYGNDLARFNQGDGRAIYFGRSGAGAYTDLIGDFHAQLAQGTGLTLALKDGSVEQFNTAGKLLSMADRNGNTTSLTYGTNGFLSSVTDPFGRVLTITTNANGQVLSLSDSMGTIASYTYGGSNELLSVTYADNSAFNFSYDGGLRLTTVTDALGNIVESHTYDGQGRAITSERQGGVDHYSLSYVGANETDVTDALGHVTRYFFDTSNGRNVVTQVEGLCSCGGGSSRVQTWTYDNQLNVTSKTDALNHTTSYTYDGNGNRLTAADAVGTVTYTYNGFAAVLTLTDQLNGVTTNTYDAQGNLLSSTDARGKTTNFINDSRGLLSTVTDARGKVTSFAYDASGNLVTKIDALNHQTTFAYDARSRLASTTNALGNVTAFAYDAVGRLKQVTQADGTTISYEYDPAGRRTAMTDAKGNRTTYGYDGVNRLTSEMDALNQATSYSYDSMSNLTASTDALGRTTNFDYDDFNRLAKVTYSPATTGATRLFETVEYDADGNVTERIDTAGRATQYQYDAVNRLISVTDPAAQVTQYEYNARSQTTALVDAIGQRYRFNYNSVGAVTRVHRGAAVMTFTYDAVGNRKTRTDYNGAPTDYTYDALNRLKTISYPDTTTVSYTYDKLSRLQTATNENGMIDFDYNKMNRLTRATDVFGQIVEYHYDDNGNRTRLSLNSGIVATYRYDALNRPTKILDGSSAAFTFDYDAADRLTQKKAPNNVKTSYQYDDLDRLTRLTDAKGALTLRDRQYQYNAASQITQIAEPSIARSYGYDATDRLTSASYTNPLQPNENYAYDSVGNRTSSQLSANYGYQPFNRLTNTSTASYSYDANGNLISRTESGGTTQYVWDFENRLKQVTLPNGSTVTYKYDAIGRRVQRTRIGGISTNFVYDGQDVVKDSNSDSSTVDYLNGPGTDNKLRLTDSRLAATGPLYFLQDHLGSTTALTNSQGVAVSQISYDGFGNPSTSANLTRYTYTGREFDSDTGLYYYRARWYDPNGGRFISEDPVGFLGGLNWYGYVTNNPLNFADPSGQWETPAHEHIIEEAFKGCLSKAQRQRLKDASGYIDGLLNGGQSEHYAYQHGMRGGPGQSERDARDAADNFVTLHERNARNLAPKGCDGGPQKISGDALYEFGQALHTITDMTSPAHEGFQVWDGPPYPTGIPPIDAIQAVKYSRYVWHHHQQETLDVLKSDPVRFERIKQAAREAFAKTFGDCGCCSN